ncbi:DUF3800 domain-containing protein [Jidongwangia harbinensis]|uniref:DUF3800 domain-containing protein n=1 Tax=Jidongwangia harbinensis TaxID=2878561 RepID=UPI001CD91A8C|nr:DUF3800 domain-containing protein [Jidongwangia harbinensis]MCA2215899.1 DUF3800 domain-containing protein [Jidongwangia harbinensis]
MREIACDESGYEGEKLVDTTTDVFAHAGVHLDAETAGALIRELRGRIRSPATQYKAGHLLREKNRAALEWFLGPQSPVYGHGHVFLVDKAHHVRTQLAGLLDVDADSLPRAPYFLSAANDVLRVKDTPGVVDEFFRVSGPAVDGTGPARDRIELFRRWLRSDPAVNTVLDPLVPALVTAVDRWGPVRILHDRQIMLPERRIARIRERCDGRLIEVRFVDAESHPQIQVADILAGTVRHVASRDLAGHGDPVLTALAGPYVHAASILLSYPGIRFGAKQPESP